MKKILYTLALSTYIVSPDIASAALNCSIDTSSMKCSNYNYTFTGTCYGNYMACPFDTRFKICDKEVEDTSAFKYQYSVNTTTAKGWTSKNSDWNKHFIVGAQSCGYKKATCGRSVGTKTTDKAQYMKHSHSSSTTRSGLHCQTIETGASNTTLSGYWSYTFRNQGYTSVSKTTTGTISIADGFANKTEINPVNVLVSAYQGYTNPSAGSSITQNTLNTSTTPSCASMGYIDEVRNCPGTYLKCPFDTNAVMCDLEAVAGEIKFSYQTADHNGWLLINGRSLSDTKYDGLRGVTNLSSLPNYNGKYFRINSGTTSAQNVIAHDHTVSYTQYTVTGFEFEYGGVKSMYVRDAEQSKANDQPIWGCSASIYDQGNPSSPTGCDAAGLNLNRVCYISSKTKGSNDSAIYFDGSDFTAGVSTQETTYPSVELNAFIYVGKYYKS